MLKVNNLFLLGIILAGTASAKDEPLFSRKTHEILATVQCRDAVNREIQRWDYTGEWTKHFAGDDNSVILRTPTKNFATWISLHINQGRPELSVIKPQSVVTFIYDKKCAVTKAVDGGPRPKGYFDDIELSKLLRGKNGIIYAWSPAMPYSVDGISEIKTAGKKLNIPVKIVMSPAADARAVNELVKKGRVLASETKMYNSLELAYRGMTLHDPSILIYKDGKLQRWARPGHERADRYEYAIKQVLK